jgi:hypothetical protein
LTSHRHRAASGPILLSVTKFTLLALVLLSSASALKLPATDCAKSPNDTRCTWNTSASSFGKIGLGTPFALGGAEIFGSGFIDEKENALYLPLEIGGNTDGNGAVFRVDLATGNRSVISGVVDGEERRGKGGAYISDRGNKEEAWDLGGIQSVRPLADGSIAALVSKSLIRRSEIIKVDRASGNRSILWANHVYDDAARPGPTSIHTIEEALGVSDAAFCKSSDRLIKPGDGFETDGKNSFYLFTNNNPAGTVIGLVKVGPGQKCAWITQYDNTGVNITGEGPTINTLSPIMNQSGRIGNTVYGVTGPNPNGNTLFSVDLGSGARTTVSLKNVNAPARSKGQGEAQVGYGGAFAFGKGLALTVLAQAAGDGYFEPVKVDLKTGDRTQLAVTSGPLKSNIRDSDQQVVANLPGTNSFIIGMKGSLYIFNADTGASYTLSQ